MHGSSARDVAATLRSERKSCVCIARYLRQSMDWVEALTLDELNRWGEVLAEVLIEERGGNADSDGPSDPYGVLRSED